MDAGRGRRSGRSRALWGLFGVLLLVGLFLAYFQFSVHPSLWEILTNSGNL